jgi:hypothetical protein
VLPRERIAFAIVVVVVSQVVGGSVAGLVLLVTVDVLMALTLALGPPHRTLTHTEPTRPRSATERDVAGLTRIREAAKGE